MADGPASVRDPSQDRNLPRDEGLSLSDDRSLFAAVAIQLFAHFAAMLASSETYTR
jgi:hypothetical protein